MTTDEFRNFLDDLGRKPPLENLLPPSHLLYYLMRYNDDGSPLVTRKSDGQVAEALRRRVESEKLFAKAAGYLAAGRFTPEFGDSNASSDISRKAKETLALLENDYNSTVTTDTRQDTWEKVLARAVQWSGRVVLAKDIQAPLRPSGRSSNLRAEFGFGAVPLVVIGSRLNGVIEASPLLPNFGELAEFGRPSGAGEWAGLIIRTKAAGRKRQIRTGGLLMPCGKKAPNFIFNAALRCRLYPWQVRLYSPETNLVAGNFLPQSPSASLDSSQRPDEASEVTARDATTLARRSKVGRKNGSDPGGMGSDLTEKGTEASHNSPTFFISRAEFRADSRVHQIIDRGGLIFVDKPSVRGNPRVDEGPQPLRAVESCQSLWAARSIFEQTSPPEGVPLKFWTYRESSLGSM